MPHSLVLNLLPTSPIPPGFTSNKSLHGLFLNLVSSVDETLGNDLHANNGNKPFTLSPLQINKSSRHNPKHPEPIPKKPIKSIATTSPASPLRWTYRKPITPGTPCWWRISLLDDALFGRLSQLWLNLNPDQPWHLGPANLHITSILGTPQSTQPWANFCNYQQLYDQASDSMHKISLRFYTPTAFRLGGNNSSMPTAHRVFSSLLRRWNHYSGLEFPADSLECLQDSQFNIRTEIVSDPRQQFHHTGAQVNPCNQFTGCVGTVTYRMLGKKVEPTIIKQLNTLADFAFYAGVGRKTPMGMGVTRRLT